jgi:hypothetical protein
MSLEFGILAGLLIALIIDVIAQFISKIAKGEGK